MYGSAIYDYDALMSKDLSYYMRLPYTAVLEADSESSGFVASIPLLNRCLTCGDTREEALRNLDDAKRQWLTTALERKVPIPEP